MLAAPGGYIHEVFSSIQGEGPWVGAFHLFFRLAGCGLRCRYCDTPQAWERTPSFRFAGRKGKEKGRNPVSPEHAVDLLYNLDRLRPGAQALAVTGGEPLEQAEFLVSFLSDARRRVLDGRPVLLETGGMLPRAMEQVAPLVDLVSMDVKIPSTAGRVSDLALQGRFMEKSGDRALVVKVVVCPRTPPEEVAEAALLLRSRDPGASFYIHRGGTARGRGLPSRPVGSSPGPSGERARSSTGPSPAGTRVKR